MDADHPENGVLIPRRFTRGGWDSPDLATLLELAARNESALAGGWRMAPWLRRAGWIFHRLRPNSHAGSRRNIRAHYDLGNAFYSSWLDDGLSYSCAAFDGDAYDLSAAQRAKHARVVLAAGIEPGHRVLEIGCGWGAFAEHAAREAGCRVDAITVSKEQHAYSKERIANAGLAELVNVKLEDYRETRGCYDRIVAIEMLEAVGEKYWPKFFSILCDRLAPGGRAVLQVILINDREFPRYRRRADFIQRHVFPGGMLPSRAALRKAVSRAGLNWIDDRSFATDYARTLAVWHQRFDAAWPSIADMGFDERFRRLWKFYLGYCEAGFRTGRLELAQITLAKYGTQDKEVHS